MNEILLFSIPTIALPFVSNLGIIQTIDLESISTFKCINILTSRENIPMINYTYRSSNSRHSFINTAITALTLSDFSNWEYAIDNHV
jgi:hypothetical protein